MSPVRPGVAPPHRRPLGQRAADLDRGGPRRADDPAPGAVIRRLHRLAPDIADAAAKAALSRPPTLEREPVPQHPGLLSRAICAAIEAFLDPRTPPRLPPAQVDEAFHRWGAAEARDGRTADTLQAALAAAADVAVEQLADHAQRHGPTPTPRQTGALVRVGLAYIACLQRAALSGHATAATGGVIESVHGRDRLLEVILRSPVSPHELRAAAIEAGWPLPRTIAAVAIDRQRISAATPPVLPPEVLNGLHLDVPCLLFPDPRGPGRRLALDTLLGGHPAVIGPAVEVTRAARSLRLARRALALLPSTVLSAHTPVHVTDHVATILLAQDPALARQCIDRKLAPLNGLRPPQRARLAATLLAYFECASNITDMAARLHIHPQTVRYRLRMLTSLFEDLKDPTQTLDYLMALHAWHLQPAHRPAAPVAMPHTGGGQGGDVLPVGGPYPPHRRSLNQGSSGR